MGAVEREGYGLVVGRQSSGGNNKGEIGVRWLWSVFFVRQVASERLMIFSL